MSSLVHTLHFLNLSVFQPNLFSYGQPTILIQTCRATPFRDKDSVSHSKIQSVGWKIDIKLCVYFWNLFSIFLLEVCFLFLHLLQQFIKIQGLFTSITKGLHSQSISYHKKQKIYICQCTQNYVYVMGPVSLISSRLLPSFSLSGLKACNSVYVNKHYVLLNTCKGNVRKFILIYVYLTLILLMWRIWWAPTNAIKWQMGFNLAFKELSLRFLFTTFKESTGKFQ